VKTSVVFVGLRRLRAPIIMLVVMFAVGVAGLVLIPGVDAAGNSWHMNFTQALYFMSYTATTIGFGEIPQAFTDTQRLWVTALIFASVVGWAYLVACILQLARDDTFRSVLTEAAFARGVRSIREPFYLICGFGETGLLVARTLDRMNRRFVVVDVDPNRVQELNMLDLGQTAPGLCADARLPDHLREAGLTKRECAGVLALTNDDNANLAVAMAVRLLNPLTPVLARAMSREIAANMASFRTDHIIDPFSRFGSHLALALAAPASHRVISWLTAPPESEFVPGDAPPRGRWVVCGYGRFGRAVVGALRTQDLEVSIIDPREGSMEGIRTIRGAGTEAASLLAAGIRESVGIVAGTDDDINNLSIVVTARELNPALFTVVRQNLQANGALFDAFGADVTMVSSEIIANECLAVLKTPCLAEFLALVRERKEDWAQAALARLGAVLGSRVPEVWSVTLSGAASPAIHQALRAGRRIPLGDLARDPADRNLPLPLLALSLTREGRLQEFPNPETPLERGDQILYAGTLKARREQSGILHNLKVCDYVLTGIDAPASWVWRRAHDALRASTPALFRHRNDAP
jgi:Trk K+ transport system NAD-binding subunit